ncbi:MAG: hypothetical protein HY238_16160 [Acidobacteria bacterium]|nr:hypothetical protein [Acidobacteriota bacterium]
MHDFIISHPAGRDRRLAAGLLILYGIFLLWTNSRVTVFDDEALMVGLAHKSVRDLVTSAVSGAGEFHHPPLSELVLHFWLRLTGGSLALLRVPSIGFYCVALWMVAETAQLLWGGRWMALALAVAWPSGYFLGRPAGWYALTMLEISGLAWCYVLWRSSGRLLHLAGFTAWAILLVYTNHFGWVFVAALGADLCIFERPEKRRLGLFFGAVGIVGLAYAPLVLELWGKLSREVGPRGALLPALARGLYMAHSLLPSEMAAPWTWPGMVAAAGAAGLLWLGWRDAASRRSLLWLAAPLVIGLGTGIMTGVRLSLFGPWLLLFLSSLLRSSGRGPAGALVAAVFAMGWLGIVTGRYQGTHRYSEPWPEAVNRVMEWSQPGDVIICNHPSFYFYVSQFSQGQAEPTVPSNPVSRAGRTFVSIYGWRRAEPGPSGRILYVATTKLAYALASEQDFLAYASAHLRLDRESRMDPDRSAPLKHYWFPGVPQPEWRIRIQLWTPAPR